MLHKSIFGCVVLVAVGAVGCGISVQHVNLPMPAADAPRVWVPIMECAKERGYRIQDMTTAANDPHVNVFPGASDLIEITYGLKDGHVEMKLEIWAKTTDEDREKIWAQLRKQGDDVWACATQRLSGPPPTAAPPAH